MTLTRLRDLAVTAAAVGVAAVCAHEVHHLRTLKGKP